MQKLSFLLIICLGLGIGACSTDFDLNSDWQEIAVVYGLLDQTEERQYIRLNKAFLTESNAIDAAQVSDSLHFENATVVLKAYSNDEYDNVVQTIEMEKVDASDPDDDFPDKEEESTEGEIDFANSPYYLYYTDEPLVENYYYELEITTDQGNKVKARTPLVRDFNTLYPKSTTELNLISKKKIRWREAGNGEIYDLTMDFTYREEANNDPTDFEIKTISYKPFANFTGETIGNNILEFELDPEVYLSYLVQQIGTEDAAFFKRIYMAPVTFTFFAGSEDLATYAEVAGTNTSGVNNGQARPIYTNVENGIGLFASRYKKVIETDLSAASLEEIICGDITKGLRFVYTSASSVECD